MPGVGLVINVCSRSGHFGMGVMGLMGRTGATDLVHWAAFLANEAAVFHRFNDSLGCCLAGIIGYFDDAAGAVKADVVDA